uniref:THAP domain-containing protein 1 n=1 Tax=Pundamilia nyererei TaxID=303518 RepID=A0A3B4GB32_9CICH
MPFWIVWTFSVSSPKQNWPLCICRFPKDPEQRQKWLTVAQRDEGSLRSNSYICSRHFDPSCYTLNEDGQPTLSSDAVPSIMPDEEVTQKTESTLKTCQL